MQKRIERNFEQRAEKLQLNINHTLQILSALSALFYSNNKVNSEMFDRFVEINLEEENSIVSLAWIPIITNEQRKEFEASIGGSASHGRQMHNINSHGLVNVPFHQDLYYPIQFLYSKYNTKLFTGLNLGTQYKIRKKLEQSAKERKILVTDAIKLQQGKPGALIVRAFKPVYSKNENLKDVVSGFVLAEIDLEHLLRVVDDEQENLSILLFDLDSNFYEQILFRNLNAFKHFKEINNVEQLSSIEKIYWTRYYSVGNKQWLIAFIDLSTGNRSFWLPLMGLIFGLLLTLIISIYIVLFWNKTREVVRLKSESEAKSKYIQAIGHDLRQPLNVMNLHLNNLEKSNPDKPEAKNSFISSMRNSIDGLHHMFSSLLDITRLESNLISTQRSTFELEPLLTDLADEFDLIASQKNLEFRMRCQDISLKTDKILFERALRNLLDNAIKYTDSGKIFLGARKHGPLFRIYIMDTGKGIEHSEIETILQPYQRGASSSNSDGLGLGLAIVKQSLDLLNIEMDIYSEKDKGTSIVLTYKESDK
jgi:signal transduction histidine kinase